ncbi:cupin domain-containing protein [Falsiroseomonas sp. CW058]|uniref:cupin domain-containing protein n=1 Tax=Falsiroseomonas sp. CW058 TaxID=3388664 RepID=UPI003D31FE55
MTSPTLAEAAWAQAFGDLSVDDGLALREGTAWRHFPAPDPARHAGLLSIADLDAFLATDAARAPRLSMADGSRKGSAAVPPEDYLRDDGRADLPNLFRRFDAGATLVVSQFHEMHPALQRFCRGLEQVFLHAVQANIYLTPPGAQGFRVHYDTHDVLVLQVTGEKKWRLWDHQPFPQPTRRTPWPGNIQPEGEPTHLTLRPGDSLYVPRGVMHDAAAQDGDAPSLHVTVGLLEPSFAAVLRLAVDLLEGSDPALRAAFPTWRLAEGPGALAALAQPLAARLAEPAALERTALALLDRLAEDRPPLLSRGLFVAAPAPGAPLRIAAGALHALVPDAAGGASLRWAGDPIALDGTQAGWVERLAEGASPAELGEGAAEFCARLLRLGLLEAARPD